MTLAELAGGDMSISLVSKIERGRVRPSLATLELLAARLGVPTAELLGGPASRAGDAVVRGGLAGPNDPAAAEALVRALLVRADALARAGRLDDAQEAYGRA